MQRHDEVRWLRMRDATLHVVDGVGHFLPQEAPERIAAHVCRALGFDEAAAASAIGGARGEKTYIEYCIDYAEANSPLVRDLTADDVGATAAFLSSPLAAGITGTIVYVDNGLQAMAAGIDAKSFDGYQFSYPFEMPGCPPAPVPE